MPGHKDPEGTICKDEKGLLYVKVGETKPEPVTKKVEGDLNGDGVFDKKDKSIAGKVLAKSRKKK